MKRLSLFGLSLLLVFAGVNHFLHEAMYLAIMPPWLPAHRMLVIISGVCEIVLGLLLFIPQTRRSAAWCIIALFIAVFPANIQMTINYAQANHPYLWLTIIRLPVQLLLIWWAYGFTRSKSEERTDKKYF